MHAVVSVGVAQDELPVLDLAEDVRENGDLKRERPREFERLKAKFAAWDKQVLPRLAESR